MSAVHGAAFGQASEAERVERNGKGGRGFALTFVLLGVVWLTLDWFLVGAGVGIGGQEAGERARAISAVFFLDLLVLFRRERG